MKAARDRAAAKPKAKSRAQINWGKAKTKVDAMVEVKSLGEKTPDRAAAATGEGGGDDGDADADEEEDDATVGTAKSRRSSVDILDEVRKTSTRRLPARATTTVDWCSAF